MSFVSLCLFYPVLIWNNVKMRFIFSFKGIIPYFTMSRKNKQFMDIIIYHIYIMVLLSHFGHENTRKNGKLKKASPFIPYIFFFKKFLLSNVCFLSEKRISLNTCRFWNTCVSSRHSQKISLSLSWKHLVLPYFLV